MPRIFDNIEQHLCPALAELQERLDLAMLFISHDLGVVEYISDTVVAMYLGHIMETAPARTLCRTPKHPLFLRPRRLRRRAAPFAPSRRRPLHRLHSKRYPVRSRQSRGPQFMPSPDGRGIMIAGANRGIGHAIAPVLHQAGYSLSLDVRRIGSLDAGIIRPVIALPNISAAAEPLVNCRLEDLV